MPDQPTARGLLEFAAKVIATNAHATYTERQWLMELRRMLATPAPYPAEKMEKK